MKKYISDFLRKKKGKTIVSLLAAFVMFFGVMPVAEIGDYISNFDYSYLQASAADDSDAPDPDFPHNEGSATAISLYVKDFYKYSQNYQKYPKYHQHDEIMLRTTGGDSAWYEFGFEGLGTEKTPFAGSIYIEANGDVVLNLDAPLFSYVEDTVVLNNNNNLKISRFYGNFPPSGYTMINTTPLLAEHVVPGDSDKPKATWNVLVTKPSATDDGAGELESFGGMIGVMKKSAKLTLNATMNQVTGDTDPISMYGKSDLGLACGLMEEGSELTFAMSATRKVEIITTTSGDVGGLVGEMQKNSVFSYSGTNCQNSQKEIKTESDGYAGGIVGKMTDATVNLTNSSAYTVNQIITGTLGSGSIYGYYDPKSGETTVDLTKYSLNAQVNGTGDTGGLYGTLDTDESFTINSSSTITSKHQSGSADSYGGLIGRYKNSSLDNALTISSITTNPTRGGNASYFGGAIGIVDEDNAAYVKFNNFTVNKAYSAGMTFGGLVGKAANAFIDADTVTIKTDGRFAGGGLVGDLGNGVLRMIGTTDLSGALCTAAETTAHLYGQIVGNRDSALIFAKSGWTLKRSAAVKADDVGGWGEVIRFASEGTFEESDQSFTSEQLEDQAIITINETTHTVSVEECEYEIDDTADFAKVALRIQLSDTDIVSFSGDVTQEDAASADLTISTDLDLGGIGFTGFTRDNNGSGTISEIHCAFKGTLSADGVTVTLAIGEPYGHRGNTDLSEASTRTDGDGCIYNHRYNGLFGVANSASLTPDSMTLDGSVNVAPIANTVYVGSVCGVSTGSTTVYNMEVDTEFNYGGDKDIYLGRLIGEISSPNSAGGNFSVDITGCTLNGDVKGGNASANTCVGGVIGKIYHTVNEKQSWYLDSVTVGGKIENTSSKADQMIGGLIAVIEGYSSTTTYSKRELTLDNVQISGLEITGNSTSTMGGFFGYRWRNTDVLVGSSEWETNVSIDSSSKITATGSVKDMAALVYNATGKWTVVDLDIGAVTVSADSLTSFGIMVNKGWYCDSGKNYKTDGSSSAIYMLLPTTGCYSIASGASLPSASVFDEIVAYSAYYSESNGVRSGKDSSGNEYILQNGAGVISIHTAADNGLTMDGTNESKSYAAKTSNGQTPNPWSRYYYNLEAVTVDNSDDWGSASAQQKLMSWGLNKYAHRSIRTNFYDGFGNKTITNDTYNMQGYSWYPVDIETDLTVKGTFKFYNYEFEQSEDKKSDSKKTSLTRSSAPTTTQHYLLHTGLFRHVYSGKTLKVNSVTLQGNVGLVGNYSGMLVSGKVEGSSDTNKATIDIDGLTLEGAYIHNIANVSAGSATYAPLVINKITQYTKFTAKNIKTSNASGKTYTDSSYVANIKYDGSYPKAASSLIGAVGSSDAKGINLEFTLIKLDGRTDDVGNSTQNSALDTAYGTNRSIFTRATLLDKFEYESGSTGTYTYTWANDWSSGRNVTYGKEVGYITEGEYADLERIYLEEPNDTSARYTNPTDNADTSGTAVASIFTDSFQPYVYTGFDPNGTTHQIKVNHRSVKAEGCGTYNDPYKIANGPQLETFANILNGSYDGTSVILPSSTERSSKWCGGTNHKEYRYNNGSYVNVDNASDTLSTDTVRTYLAGAYYQLQDSIELSNTFVGLGCQTIADNEQKNAVFRGVIDGKNFTITNKSARPLINNSYGSVVTNLVVAVDNPDSTTNNITLKQDNMTDKFPTCKSYGGVMGAILGGDNIIDNVTVTYSSNTTVYVVGSSNGYQAVPVGGYVGVIVDGGLIFRNMEGKAQNLTFNVKGGSTAKNASPVDFSSKKFLYVNPIIGRVIDGFAVTESDAYRPFEDGTRTYGDGSVEYWQANGSVVTKTAAQLAEMTEDEIAELVDSAVGVTLKNGSKHYSITDIKSALKKENDSYILSDAEKLYPKNNNAIDVPNAQAFFLMSLMVNSGMSIMSDYNTASYTSGANIGYYFDNATTRGTAQYNQIGTNNTDDYTLTQIDGRWQDKTNTERTTTSAYLIRAYTKQYNSSYYARKISHNTVSNTVNLVNATYYLPDGFKGIGNFFHALADLRLGISTFDGKGATVSQNSSYYYYYNKNDMAYDPSKTFNGFGLINTTAGNGTYKNFYLTGNVKTDLIDTGSGSSYTSIAANVLDTISNNNPADNKYLCAGSMIGTISGGTQNVTNVALRNIDVFGLRSTGGMIGFITGLGTLNYKIESSVAATAYNSDGIKVHGRASTGGLMGKANTGYVKVDMNNHTFNLSEVVCECGSRGGNYYDYGVGGFIGMMRAGQNSVSLSANSFKNIVIGTPDKEQTVKCENADLFTAGVVGIMNKSKGITIDNCTFYNLKVKAKFGAAGLVAFPTTYTQAKVTNTHLYSPLGSTIESTSDFAGGFIGSSDPRVKQGSGSEEFRFENCSIDGYTVSGAKAAGGIIGFRGAWGDSVNLILDNIEVNDCTISSGKAAGGLVGEMNEPVVGYNILMKDVVIDSTGQSAYQGYLCGFITTTSADVTYDNNTKGRTGTKPTIRIAGLSRIATDSDTMKPELVGTCNYGSGNEFGTDGYVVFADYTNAASDTLRRSAVFSSVNSQNNVTITDNDNKPYVTSSPKTFIGTNQFLTGDAMSAQKKTDANFAFTQIVRDMRAETNDCYYNAPEYNETKYNDVYSNLSTSNEEYGVTGMSNFPMLVVEDNDKSRVTNYINYYLQNLTNTKLDFAACNVSGTTNYTKFRVALNKCTYDSQTRTFTIDNDDASASLKLTHRVDKGYNYFQMSASEIDNANSDVQQFSLLDVQFFDPATVSGTSISDAKIAYHLYVPVYVKKLIQFEFSAKFASNTNYYRDAYSTIKNANTLFENLGNPVTMKIEYTYSTRTEDDWKNAINGGDSVLTNYYKSLNLKMNDNGWIPNSRMVLVDANNNDISYYNDTALTSEDYDAAHECYHIDFDKFTTTGTSSGQAYSPAPFNSLMDITIVESEEGEGTLIRTNESDTAATVKGIDGYYYKPCPEDDTTSTRYTVSKVENIRPETYYISFFTNKNSGAGKFYHYEIQSRDSFAKRGTDDVNWRPNKVSRNANDSVHLLIGELYSYDNMELEVVPLDTVASTKYEMRSTTNNLLTITMTSHIGLTRIAADAQVQQNLASNPDSTIYQTFLMNFDKQERIQITDTLSELKSKIGIEKDAIKSITIQEYKIYHGATASGEGTTVPYSNPYDHITNNYIELRNNQNLNEYLRDSTEGHNNMATIQVIFCIEYLDQSLSSQFPQRKELSDYDVGAMVRGSTNISSVAEGGAYSSTSKVVTDMEGSSANRYYTTDLARASLTYNAKTTDQSANGKYSSLGINPFDDGTKDSNKGHIDSTAMYNYSNLQGTDEYIEFNITLLSKTDGYSDAYKLNLSQYLQNITVTADDRTLYDGTDTSTTDLRAYLSGDGKTLTIRAKNDKFHKIANKIYSLDISYDVLTGESNGFGTTKAYSNYMVKVTADMYDSIDTTATPDTQPHASDHIIYTNSKLQYQVI